jgi:hypothetical protein
MELVTLSYIIASLNNAYNLLNSVCEKPILLGKADVKIARDSVKSAQTELSNVKSILGYYSTFSLDSHNVWAKCDKMRETVDVFIEDNDAFKGDLTWNILKKDQFQEIQTKRIKLNRIFHEQMKYSKSYDEAHLKNYIQRFDECLMRAENIINNRGSKESLGNLRHELDCMIKLSNEIHQYSDAAIVILIERLE